MGLQLSGGGGGGGTPLYKPDMCRPKAFMSRIDLVSKNLLTGSFRNFSKERFKENCYQKSIEQIANFAKIEKVTKIFLASEKIE